VPKLIASEIILFKVESTYNTDATPAVGDAVLVEGLQWDNRGARMNERPAIRSSLGQLKQVYGGTLVGFRFDVEIKGSGAAGTAPEAGALLQCCRMSETIVGGTSVTYKPSSGAAPKSGTLYYYEDGKLWKITGVRGEKKGRASAGGRGILSFDMTGHIFTESDSALVSPTYDTTVPPVFLGATFAVDGYAATIEALSWELGNVVAMPPNVNAADGYGEIIVAGRDVKGQINPESVLLGTYDFRNKWKTNAQGALDTGVIGSVAGNRWRVQMPAISYREISPAERERVRCYDVGFGAAESTTDDEISLIYT
jgi:hypothetical protein